MAKKNKYQVLTQIWNNWNSSTLLIVHSTTSENSLAVSSKAKHTPIMWFWNSLLGINPRELSVYGQQKKCTSCTWPLIYTSQWLEILKPFWLFHFQIYIYRQWFCIPVDRCKNTCCFIHYSSNNITTHISTNRRVGSYCNNMDASHGHNVTQKKSDIK